MRIEELVNQAARVSKKFRKDFKYHTKIWNKPVTLAWLMPRLEVVLGKEYVREQARKHIADTVERLERAKTSDENNAE